MLGVYLLLYSIQLTFIIFKLFVLSISNISTQFIEFSIHNSLISRLKTFLIPFFTVVIY